MIESLDTDIADGAVRGAGRSVDVTGIAVLNLQMMGLYVHSVHFIHQRYSYYMFADGNSSELG